MNSKHTIIIAEAGVNHNGSLKMAKKLIDVASDAGVDYVKFQTFKADELVTKNAEKSEYQKTTAFQKQSQYEMLKKLELDRDSHIDLVSYCKNKKVDFISTPFDIGSINLLDELNIPLYKIPSGEITNLPYLEHIGSKNKPIIMSTGMSNLKEIREALNILYFSGLEKNDITLLHCNSEYPTPFEDVNLKAMLTMKNEFNLSVGYSDHTIGIEISVAAVAMGAEVIEKHFTLDKNLSGPDHSASLSPIELKNMANAIRNIDRSIGNGIKRPSKSEIKNIQSIRKSIVSKTNIKEGDVFSDKNLAVKRPGKGISPMKWYEIIGQVSKRNYKKNDLII